MNESLKRIITLIFLGFLLGGCASITSDGNSVVSMQTKDLEGNEVTAAKCELVIEGGKYYISTPGTINVPGDNDDMMVTCRKEGYKNGSAKVISEVKGNMFANIILGGGIGAFIDHSNGSAYRWPSFIEVTMGDFVVIGDEIEDGATTTNAMGQTTPYSSTKNTSNTQNTQKTSKTPKTSKTQETPNTNKKMKKVHMSTEDKLKELKKLKDQGLIDEETYDDFQDQILDEKF